MSKWFVSLIDEERKKESMGMKIGVIQASSQASKNKILYEAVQEKAKGQEVINFGCFPDELETYSYIDISIAIGLLLNSQAVDFIVSGCSSGQGMMLACNTMPNVICGYIPTPQDAYLFGRINNGNAVSFPLGLNYGWGGEINLSYAMESLFSEAFGIGYPKQDAERKKQDSDKLKMLKEKTHKPMISLLEGLDDSMRNKVLGKTNVSEYILQNGRNSVMIEWIKANMHKKNVVQDEDNSYGG